jgi:thiosulfate sulfurtransferase
LTTSDKVVFSNFSKQNLFSHQGEIKMADIINVWQVRELLYEDAATIIDTRDLLSYKAGHIPKAISLAGKSMQETLSVLDKERPVVVYCDQGNFSKGTAVYFSEQGFKEVYSMTGGFGRWVETYTDIEES